jgi:2-iminoacetate synthase ThiH
MSALVDRAIRESSLDDVLGARRDGTLTGDHVDRLRASDLLVLGALADRVRAEEVGDEVRIYTEEAPESGPDVAVLPRPGQELTGLELLREVAIARATGPRGVRVRVDWTRCGLELAQIAMGFGANELAGRIVSKRGLPLAEGEKLGVGKKSRLEAADVVKRKELEGFVRRAGRTPSFVTLAQETT